jgi:flagellar biosynthesis protein FlhG
VTDQAYNLRKMAWEKNKKAKYLTVSSGKGGVGKTNFAVNLACALSNLGKKVLVFDADIGLANVDILINVKPEKTIYDYLEGKVSIKNILISSEFGFDIFPSASGFLELSNLTESQFEKLLEIFVNLDENYEVIIFDTGAGISENVIRFANIADEILIITQPEPTAVTDAYALMKVIHNEYGKEDFSIIVNRVKNKETAIQIFEHLKKVTDKFLKISIKLRGFLREDINLIRAVKAQKPLFFLDKNSKYIKDIKLIALSISGNNGNQISSRNSIFDFVKRFAK